MIPSHTKVAWAFLDKLLGRTPPKPDKDPSTMTMAERNLVLDKSTEQMSDAMHSVLARMSKKATHEVRKVAAAYDLDPRAIFWILTQPRKRWPRMPRNLLRWLDVASSSIAQFGNAPSMPGRVKYTPEVEALVGSAFLELGRWAQTTMKPELERAYLKVLQNEARDLVPVYTYPGDPVPTLPKVTLALMHEFEWRLEHAKLSVGSAHLMERVFRLFT